MNIKSAFLNLNNEQNYCSVFLPKNDRQIKLTLLVAEAFGEEKRAAARMLVRLADKLTEYQIATFMFDFSGTGDSTGESVEIQWQDWKKELLEAAKYIRNEGNCQNLALLGTRAGTLLAAEAASEIEELKALILLEPILKGEELLTELEKKQQIKAAISGIKEEKPEDENVYAEFAAFQASKKFAEQMKTSEMQTSLQKCPKSCNIQMIRVSGAKTFPQNWNSIINLLNDYKNSQAILVRDKPFWGQLEYYESDEVINPVIEFLTKITQN